MLLLMEIHLPPLGQKQEMRGYECSLSVRSIQSLKIQSLAWDPNAVLYLPFPIHPNFPQCKFWVDLQANTVFANPFWNDLLGEFLFFDSNRLVSTCLL